MSTQPREQVDFHLVHNVLTDGSWTVFECTSGHDCGHHHLTWEAADRCCDKWMRRANRRIAKESAQCPAN